MNACQNNNLDPLSRELERQLGANEGTLQREFVELQISGLHKRLKLIDKLVISLLFVRGEVQPLDPGFILHLVAGDELKEIDFYRIRYYLSSGDTPKRN